MIAAAEPQEFVPCGRRTYSKHPGKYVVQAQTKERTGQFPSLQGVSVRNENNEHEYWMVRKTLSCPQACSEVDEELFWQGRTVVWSTGCTHSVSKLQKTYTVEEPILEVHFVTFTGENSGEHLSRKFQAASLESDTDNELACICIVHIMGLTIFTDQGQEFYTSLPFQVRQAWSLNGGMLLERVLPKIDVHTKKGEIENLPTLFSFKHPLDEPAPVLCRTGGQNPKLHFMSDPTQNVIFTHSQPNLVMTFDTALGLHSVWSVRKAKQDEINAAWKLLDVTSGQQISQATPHHYSHSSSTLAGLSASAHSRLSESSFSPGAFSPVDFRQHYTSSRVASPLSRPHTPGALSMSAARSMSHSMLSLNHLTPSSVHRSPASFMYSPFTSGLRTPVAEEISDPLTPDLYLEQNWTENMTGIRQGILGKAKKVFLTQDLCSQQYLCYLVERPAQLKCLKFGSSNDQTQIIFGSVTAVPAIDAVPLVKLSMMVILDPSGGVILQTGTTQISKILVPGLPPSLGSSTSMSHPRPSTPLDSPRVTSLESADEVMLLSPVEHIAPDRMDDFSFGGDFWLSSSQQGHPVVALRDAVENRFTLVCSSGTMLRTSIPSMYSSPVVKLCLDALKSVLPRDASLQLLIKWYTTHNGPGENTSQSEWSRFAACLLGLMGYKVDKLVMFLKDTDTSSSPVVTTKKRKPSGWDEDWEYLLHSSYHQSASQRLPWDAVLDPPISDDAPEGHMTPYADITSALFQHIPTIATVLHLVYEEILLNRFHHSLSVDVAAVVCQVACDLEWKSYVEYYCKHHPSLLLITKQAHCQIKPEFRAHLQYPHFFSTAPPSFQHWMLQTIIGTPQEPFPCLDTICSRTHQLLALYSLYFKKVPSSIHFVDTLFKRLSLTVGVPSQQSLNELANFVNHTTRLSAAERTVLYMSKLGWTAPDLESLPASLSLPLYQALAECRENPPNGWPESAYVLLVRKDLAQQIKWLKRPGRDIRAQNMRQTKETQKTSKSADLDGMGNLNEDLLKLRFPDDLRVKEVRRLLQSSKPVTIALTQKPEVSDHEFLEEQETKLVMVCQRTMALPVARGMFTMYTNHAIMTETLPIPDLTLTGRAPPRNTTINAHHLDIGDAWPHFHNGVAAGLQLMPTDPSIDSAWIVYNQPQGQELTNGFAGFLMALGLSGHLSQLAKFNVHNYLCAGHEMTGIGLILGLAAAKRGTMDVSTTKVLSVHVGALLPATLTELDIRHNVKVAAILGIGLVYQGTAHRHMAEILSTEIGRPPGPELENCTNRESYSLAAGLALGMVLLKHGSDAVGLSDLNLADQLYLYMAGGHKKTVPSASGDNYRSPCYQIREGDQVNVDVTSPGATLALGLMFLQTGNKAVSQWLAAPDTPYLLELVKPDFLLLRTLSRGMILWDEIRPTEEWVNSNIPVIVQKFAFKNLSAQEEAEEEIDAQTMSQGSCNITAGACMALGLRFAGTGNKAAYVCLMKFAEKFISLSTASKGDLAGKTTIERCLNVIILSLAMIMAGSGNLEVLRLARALRSRVSNDVNYGNHMAVTMVIGLLFLGGGRYTLSNSPSAIAALVCSLYPIFPNNSKDNRYHLQAFRHLYALAAEPRLVIPKDVDTNLSCYAPLEVTYKETSWYSEHRVQLLAPCIIPELDQIKQIQVIGPRYLPITLQLPSDMELAEKILKQGGTLFVKQRAGHLSYVEDPKGYKSLLAQSFTQDRSGGRITDPRVIQAFTSDPRIINFANFFCSSPVPTSQLSKEQSLSMLMLECVMQEKVNLLPVLLEVHTILLRFLKTPNLSDLIQLKVVLCMASHIPVSHSLNELIRPRKEIIGAETCHFIKGCIENCLLAWVKCHKDSLLTYLQSSQMPDNHNDALASFITYYDIPSSDSIKKVHHKADASLGEMMLASRVLHLPLSIVRILSLALAPER